MRILYLPNCYSQQRQREKKRFIYPVLLAMQAQYYRNLGHEVYWEKVGRGVTIDKYISEPEDIDFLKLPAPDRYFTNAFDKRYQDNGNFKYRPATYIQVANGCHWGKCSFCVEQKNKWQVRPVEDVVDELREINQLGFKEVFDDSGTFPVDKWLDSFLRAINSHKFNFRLGCNMRMVDVDYRAMRMAGFRMLLFGVESANQKTLDTINKGVQAEDIKHIINAAKAGLEPHIAVMFGYPWESDEDAERTLKTVHYLLKNGYAKTAQASFYQNPLHGSDEGHRHYVRRIYDVAKSPKFWFNKLKDVKTKDDLNYLWRQIKEGLKWNR